MRGGAARKFSSDWLSHRGIHFEANTADLLEFSNRYQRLTRHRLWLSGIHRGSHLASFGNPPWPKKETRGSHPCHLGSPSKPEPTERFDSTPKNGLTFLASLTYPLTIEELRPEDTLAGASFFSNTADSDPVAHFAGAAHRHICPAPMRTAHGPGLCTEPDRDLVS